MGLVFDPAKDRANLEKHGISLARAAEMDVALVIEDERFDYGEERYRAFGFIKDAPIAWCSRSAAMRSGQSACGARMRRK
jgi:uncharacterized DUF497 family protein